jgi:PAS domain S-box-containing protein
MLLDPILHEHELYIMFFPAVAFAAWIGGRGPGLLALLLGAVAVVWFLFEPRGTWQIPRPEMQLGLLLYVLVGGALIALIEALRRNQEQLRTTLASIGDAVITTDADGRITFLNPVAEALTGWSDAEAHSQPLGIVFRIVNEHTRQPAEDPAAKALRAGKVVGLANHALLIARDGTERPIEDSAAPIRAPGRRIVGCVLVFRDISEVRRNRGRYQLLVEQSIDGIFVATKEGRYIDVNAAGCAMLGMTREEVLGSTFPDLLDPDELPRLPAVIAAMTVGDVHLEEWRFRRKDGSTFIGELAGRQLPDGTLQGIVRDVSERKRTELAMAAGAATMEQLVASNPFGVYLVDADFRLAVVGKGAQRVFTNVHPLLGRDLAEVMRCIWPEPFASEVIGHFQRVLATGEPFYSSSTVERRADIDAMEAYDWRVERVRLPDGRFGAVCYFYDLTERQNWERRLAAATEVAEVGVYQWDVATNHCFFDDRLQRWWSVGPDDFITIDGFLERLHPDDRERVRALVHGAIDPDGHGRFAADYRVALPGQAPRWVRGSGATEFVNGVPVALTGAMIDITQHLEQESQLREQDRRKDQFLATLSHELRNPLAPIRTAADVLAHEGLTREQVVSSQRIISRQSTHLARLLDDLLDVARVTQGKMVLRREPVPLASLIDAALETARPLIDGRRHHLHVSLPPAPLVLFVDPHRMTQVLANLLSNAARYTESGGRIELEVHDGTDRIGIVVRDTGIGIPPESLRAIFDMFAQVESRSRVHDGGLGIGLALVRGLVELHGGQVSASSAGRGHGAQFMVTLPRSVVAAAPAITTDGSGDGRETSALRVLVADDNLDAADSLSELLRLAGHEVRVAYDGRTALSIADAFRPNVMLLDLGMPELNGHEVASNVRDRPWARESCLVAITGWGQETDRTAARASGFHQHLVKPVDFAELRALLARVAAGHCADRRQPASSEATD